MHNLGLTKLPAYLHTILWSALGFTFVHLVVAPLVSHRWFPDAYGTKSRRARNTWDIHIVSQVNVFVIVPLAAYAIWAETPDRALDKAFGWSDLSGRVQAVAVGYFLWDLVDAVVNFTNLGFVLHGAACFMIYLMSFRPFVAYFSTRCLLWEISTFFLNIHWFLDKTNRTGTTFQLINGVLLLLTFFGVRLVWGGYISLQFLLTLRDVWHQIPLFYTLVFGASNILLQSLNIYWFSKMIAALRSRFEGKPDERAGLLGANGNGASAAGNAVRK